VTRRGYPHFAYFFYVTKGGAGHPNVSTRRYDHGGPITDIEAVIATEAEKAVQGSLKWDSSGLGGLIWRKRSYMVVIQDDPPHVFEDETGFVIEDGDVSFTDMKFMKLDVDEGSGKTRPVQVNYCENLLKQKDNKPWTDKPDVYDLHLRPKPPYARPNHDDTGQNLGP
jgi:hypothetical protein